MITKLTTRRFFSSMEELIKNDPRNYWKKFHIYNNHKTMPNFKEYLHDNEYIQKCEIQTRILKILYDSELVDIKKFKFSDDLRKDQGLDSLNMTALLTSIEHQFTTVFEDNIFESIRTLEEVVTILARDEKII